MYGTSTCGRIQQAIIATAIQPLIIESIFAKLSPYLNFIGLFLKNDFLRVKG